MGRACKPCWLVISRDFEFTFGNARFGFGAAGGVAAGDEAAPPTDDQPKVAQPNNSKSAAVDRQENTLAGEVKILPNPAHGILKIQLPEALDADIQIVDMQGATRRQMSTRDRQIDMNIEDLPAGAYIVHIKTAKGNISRSIRIEK